MNSKCALCLLWLEGNTRLFTSGFSGGSDEGAYGCFDSLYGVCL
jgi:hypothetical protein